MAYGDTIELMKSPYSGWDNALVCPKCSGATLRFAMNPHFIEECVPTDDKAVYFTMNCVVHYCKAVVTLAVRQHAGSVHLTLTSRDN